MSDISLEGCITGEFGVWLLTAFVLLTEASVFGVILQPHGPEGILNILKEGTVSLQIGDQLRRQPIDRDGQAQFSGISIELEGKQAPVRVKTNGFRMKNPRQKVELRQGGALAVPMVPADP